MDLNHSDSLLWSDINTSIPVTGVLKEIIFQDPFHLKLEDWSVYSNCNAFSSSPCLLILDIVSYNVTKTNFNVIYLQCFVLKCIDRKLACRTWQVGQLDRYVSRIFFFWSLLIDFPGLITKQTVITRHFLCIHLWICLGWVVCRIWYAINFYLHRKYNWFGCQDTHI